MLTRFIIVLLAAQGLLLAAALLRHPAKGPEPAPPEPLRWQVSPGPLRWEPPPEAASAPLGVAASVPPLAQVASAAAAPVAGAVSAAVGASSCLEAGPFVESDRARLEPRLREALPAAEREGLRWEARARAWWVALGPFLDPDERDRQRQAARALGLAAVPVPSAPGRGDWLVLSRALDPEVARRELDALQARGLQGLRRVDITVPTPWAWRLPEATPAAREALAALDLKAYPGRRFLPCAAFEPRLGGRAASTPAPASAPAAQPAPKP